MNLFAVSFFGHREVDDPFVIEQQLEAIIRELLHTKEYVEFLVGRDGEFDQLVSSTGRRCKRTIRDDNSSLVLVLPYMTAEYRNNEQSFHEYYDEIEICVESAEKHFKSAHQVRNRSLVDRSDLVIFCVEHDSGGAYQTMRYAKKAGAKACHNKTYDNESSVRRMVEQQQDMKIPSELIPHCPVCGAPMIMNLRCDDTFVQDEGWYAAAERYSDFVKQHRSGKILYLELGVGNNTPAIIKYPFWRMTLQNPNAIYASINLENMMIPQIENQSILINMDIASAVKRLSQKE